MNESKYIYIEGISKPWDSLNNAQKSFINTKNISEKGNTLTTVGLSIKGVTPTYIYECNKCSVDSELWQFGDITGTKNDLKKEVCFCGCGKKPHWSERQYKVLVERRCISLGYIFKGWKETYNHSKNIYLVLYNPETGNTWDTCQLKIFLNCDVRDPWLAGRKSAEDNILDFMNTGSFHKDTKFWRSDRLDNNNAASYYNYTCGICSKDIYCMSGLCSGVFEAYRGELKKGVLSCRCSIKYRWTEAQREFKLKLLLEEEGGEFLGWGEDGYYGVFSHLRWNCSQGHECSTEIASFLNKNTRCGNCSNGGFDKNKPAYFYIVRWCGKDCSYLKYGVTNRNVNERIAEQKRQSSLDYEVLNTFLFPSGYVALSLESEVKKKYGRSGSCPKEYLPDGFTETVLDNKSNLKYLTDICQTKKLHY